MISFQTKITLEDYLNFNIYIFKQRWSFKFMRLLSFFFMFIFLSFLGYSWYTGEEMQWTSLGILFFSLFYLYGLPYIMKRSAKKTYKTNKILQEPITFKIDDQTVNMEAESYRSNITWDKVFKVVEDSNGIYIFQSKLAANLLPKRDISEQQLTGLKAIIRSKKGFSRKLQD